MEIPRCQKCQKEPVPYPGVLCQYCYFDTEANPGDDYGNWGIPEEAPE